MYADIRINRELEIQEIDIPSPLKTVIYRILQEALNNVAKHSGASQASVTLICEAGLIELHVRDDGRGFDVIDIPSGHLGVGIMRERAEAVGASLSINSTIGEGTDVAFVWLEAAS